MAGIRTRRKIQLGREVTKGTATAADTLWRGMGVIADEQEVTFVEEDVGMMNQMQRTYIARKAASISLESVPATFEQLPWVFASGIKSLTAPSSTDGSGQIWTYPMPTTAGHDIATLTIEAGDNQQAEEMEYSFVERFSLEGNAGEALMMSADYRGRQVSTCAFTGSILVPSVEEILFSKGKLYIDANTFGTTQITKSLLNTRIEAVTGQVPHETADGALYFSGHHHDGRTMEVSARVAFRHDSTAADEVENWRTETGRKIRMQWDGSALTTAGTTYTTKALRVDLRGNWETFEGMTDEDGDNVRIGVFRCAGDTAGADYASFTVVNELSTWP